jgi:hypothetical protein
MTSFPRGALGELDLLDRLEVFEAVVFRALVAVDLAFALGLSSVSVMYRRFLSPLFNSIAPLRPVIVPFEVSKTHRLSFQTTVVVNMQMSSGAALQ